MNRQTENKLLIIGLVIGMTMLMVGFYYGYTNADSLIASNEEWDGRYKASCTRDCEDFGMEFYRTSYDGWAGGHKCICLNEERLPYRIY